MNAPARQSVEKAPGQKPDSIRRDVFIAANGRPLGGRCGLGADYQDRAVRCMFVTLISPGVRGRLNGGRTGRGKHGSHPFDQDVSLSAGRIWGTGFGCRICGARNQYRQENTQDWTLHDPLLSWSSNRQSRASLTASFYHLRL